MDDILGLFLNYFKWFLFILTPMSGLWTKVKMFDIELLMAHPRATKIPHLLCGEGGSAMRIVPCIT